MPGVKELAQRNVEVLRQNPYPGRGIIQGVTSADEFAQVYWVMGRSPNSRNRILHQPEEGTVATTAFDISKVTDPSLIIYNAMRWNKDMHVVSNGDHTDKVIDSKEDPEDGGFLINSLISETYEPDPPNNTPRIVGLYAPDFFQYQMLKISKDPLQESGLPVHSLYDYSDLAHKPGYGYTLQTYNGDGDPLPTFDRDPYIMPLRGNADDIADYYWDVLNKDNRVAIAVKTIKSKNHVNVRIINTLGKS